MSDLFQPYNDSSIRDRRINNEYEEHTISGVDVPHTTGRKEYLTAAVTSRKSLGALVVLILGFGILVTRLMFLQLAQGAEYRDLAEGNRIRIEYTSAARGVITDRTGEPLVKNVPNFEVTVTPSNLPGDELEQEKVLIQTANILELPYDQLEQDVEVHANVYFGQPLVLQEHVAYDKALSLSTQLANLPGVRVETNASREYIDPEMFSHVLGYLSRITAEDTEAITSNEYELTDLLGKSGLEVYYEDELKGSKGRKHVEVDARGNEIEVVAKEAPTPGLNVQLAIDADLQRELYSALESVSKERGSPGGAVVAIDPNTGYIRALVSYPGFNNTEFTQGIESERYNELLNDERNPLFNKATLGEYPSGSTFKLVVAAAALQEGVVNEGTSVLSNGGVEINQWFFPDWKSGGHGQTDVRKAIAESVNTYFFLAGGGTYNAETLEIEGGLGIKRVNGYAEQFGLNKPTGVDLSAEAAGFLPTPEWKEQAKDEPWYIGDTYNASIGQGDVLVTPLQVALYTSAVANGGTVYEPRIAEWMMTQSGDIRTQVPVPVQSAGFVNSYYLQVIREGMRQAVTSGTARALQSIPVTAAGKTGTAQHGGSDKNHSWFTAFAPYENPEIVITAIVEEGGEGTEAALPVVRQGLQTYFSR